MFCLCANSLQRSSNCCSYEKTLLSNVGGFYILTSAEASRGPPRDGKYHTGVWSLWKPFIIDSKSMLVFFMISEKQLFRWCQSHLSPWEKQPSSTRHHICQQVIHPAMTACFFFLSFLVCNFLRWVRCAVCLDVHLASSSRLWVTVYDALVFYLLACHRSILSTEQSRRNSRT